MNIDFEKIKNDPINVRRERRLNKKDPTTGFGSILPGIIFFAVFAGPFLVVYLLFSWPLVSFFQERSLEGLNILLYGFIALSFVVGVITEWKQPFSTTTTKQLKKGRGVRMCAGIVQLIWLAIIVFSAGLLIIGYGREQVFSGELCPLKDIFWFL